LRNYPYFNIIGIGIAGMISAQDPKQFINC
jgi:hypothetical protein